MSDITRELAHEICEQEESCLCKPDENSSEHSRLCDAIEFALRTARNNALEEAADIAGPYNANLAFCIRILKDRS